MQEKVNEFLLAMLYMGLSHGQANAKTYDYALALLLDQEAIGSHASASIMEKAVGLIRDAWETKPVMNPCMAARGLQLSLDRTDDCSSGSQVPQ